MNIGRIRSWIKRTVLKTQAGQSTIEYVLILAVVVMIALQFKKTFSDRLSRIINNVGNDIDNARSSVND